MWDLWMESSLCPYTVRLTRQITTESAKSSLTSSDLLLSLHNQTQRVIKNGDREVQVLDRTDKVLNETSSSVWAHLVTDRENWCLQTDYIDICLIGLFMWLYLFVSLFIPLLFILLFCLWFGFVQYTHTWCISGLLIRCTVWCHPFVCRKPITRQERLICLTSTWRSLVCGTASTMWVFCLFWVITSVFWLDKVSCATETHRAAEGDLITGRLQKPVCEPSCTSYILVQTHSVHSGDLYGNRLRLWFEKTISYLVFSYSK